MPGTAPAGINPRAGRRDSIRPRSDKPMRTLSRSGGILASMRNRFVVGAVLVVSLAGCVNSPNYSIAYSPRTGKTAAPAAFRTALLAVTDAGLTIETQDATAGMILTTWEAGHGFGGDDSRYRYRIVVDGDTYNVAALCQFMPPGGPLEGKQNWSDCLEPDKRPRYVVEMVAKLAGQIGTSAQ